MELDLSRAPSAWSNEPCEICQGLAPEPWVLADSEDPENRSALYGHHWCLADVRDSHACCTTEAHAS